MQQGIRLRGCQTSCHAWQSAGNKPNYRSGQYMLGFSCQGDRKQTKVSKAAEHACALQGSTKPNCWVSNWAGQPAGADQQGQYRARHVHQLCLVELETGLQCRQVGPGRLSAR